MNTTVVALLFSLTLSSIGASESRRCDSIDTSFVKRDTLIVKLDCYDNGTPRLIRHYKNGSLHGTLEAFHPDGTPAALVKYREGEIDGIKLGMSQSGDTILLKQYSNGIPVGLHHERYDSGEPKRFTNFNDSGDKHGWEIFWYDNGNVKDSILFRNDSTMRRRSYYYNGTPQMFEDDIYGTYDAVSFNPKGKRTGRIKDGTGTVFLCDSVGGDCKELKYEDGKRVIE